LGKRRVAQSSNFNYCFKLIRTLLRNAKRSNWWRTIKWAWARWAEEDGDQRAAAFAYYLLLSLLPLTILLVTAGSLCVGRAEIPAHPDSDHQPHLAF
jgi:uncharacterized BrkB/YihY/UPF0761 family membrane protein